MRVAAQGDDLLTRLGNGFGFGQDVALKFQHLIAAQHQRLGVFVGHARGLHLGQGIRDVMRFGGFGLQRLTDHRLIHAGGYGRDVQPRRPQQLRADFRAGGKDDRSVHGKRPVDIQVMFWGADRPDLTRTGPRRPKRRGSGQIVKSPGVLPTRGRREIRAVGGWDLRGAVGGNPRTRIMASGWDHSDISALTKVCGKGPQSYPLWAGLWPDREILLSTAPTISSIFILLSFFKMKNTKVVRCRSFWPTGILGRNRCISSR